VSQDSIELIESAFAAWNGGDIRAFADLTAEDIVWLEVSGRPEGDGAELHGRERMRRSLESLFEAWETYRLDVQSVQAVGDRVVAIVREVAQGRSSGVKIDSLWGYVITVSEGQIVRVEAYRNHEQALAAASGQPPGGV